jgi:hypothetical protein
VGPAGGAPSEGAARGRVTSVGGGGTPGGRAERGGTGSAAASAGRRWGEGTVSTPPPHGEGEDPVAGDQGGDSSSPGRAADSAGNVHDPALPVPVSGGVGPDRRLEPTVVAGSRAPGGAHGGTGGVAIRWRSGFVERVSVPLPGGRGGGDFRLLPCRAKPVQRRQRLAGWVHPRLPAVVCRLPAPAAVRPKQHVLVELAALVEAMHLPESARQTLLNVYTYLKTHEDHIRYEHFKAAGLPIGSGLVESACKWLIQQCFKEVGMRWSEAGFNHLLHLRLAWVNQ